MRKLLSLALILLLSLGAHVFHHSAAALSRTDSGSPIVLLPDGKLLRHFVLGQTTTVADLYWLKLVQVFGATEGHRPEILPLAHLITDLDPEYGYAYIAAALGLSIVGRVDEAVEILTKGAENSNRWEIPYYLAFNYWYELGDSREGAYWLRRAASLPGHPEHLELLAAKLYANANDVGSAIEFMEMMASQAPSEQARAEYLARIGLLQIEADLQALEREIESFRRENGRLPLWLGELPFTGLSAPPGTYHYDEEAGAVSNDLLPTRLSDLHGQQRAARARKP